MRWYRFTRSYRVLDEVFIRADRAADARDQHWEGFNGVAYGLEPHVFGWVTEHDLIDDGEVRTGRVRRAELLDVPAWMVNAAVNLGKERAADLRRGAQEATPEVERALVNWNHGTGWGDGDTPLEFYLTGEWPR